MRITFVLISALVWVSFASLDAARTSTVSVDKTQVARGKYIVEGLSICSDCHTPRNATGKPDRRRWLQGAPVVFNSTLPVASWPEVAPRLAGAPPGTDEQFITLMTTGISRTGQPLRPPMPQFRMTRADAGSVLAYLKSLESIQ